MFKIAVTLVTLTSLVHAVEKDQLDPTGSSSAPSTNLQVAQPFTQQEIFYDFKEDKEPSRTENLVNLGKNSIETLILNSQLETQRAKNRFEAETERFDQKLNKEAERTERHLNKAKERHEEKLDKLKKKGKKKSEKLKEKAKKIF